MAAETRLRKPRSAPALPASAGTLAVYVATNPELRCVVTDPITLIGSRRDCHLSIEHADVSKLHTAVIHTGRSALVCDLRSRTGTFVNDQPIRVAAVNPGDTVRVGPIVIEFEGLEALAADAETDPADATAVASPITLSRGKREAEVRSNGVVIGRRSSCDIVLDTPDVSLAHALLFFVNERPAICDLGSRSGTLLNGERVVLAWLLNGDQLRIGGVELGVGCEWSAVEGGVSPDADLPEEVASAVRGAKGGLALNLQDLEQTLATLHGYINSSRAKLDERGAAIEEREGDLVARETRVAQQRKEAKALDADLRRRREQIETDRHDADQKLAEAVEREETLQRQIEQHMAQAAELEARRTQLDAELSGLDEQRSAVERQASDNEKLSNDLASRGEELDALGQELTGRQTQITTEREELNQSVAEAERVRSEIEGRQRELAAASAAVESERKSLAEQRGAVERDAAGLKQERETVDREQARLTTERSEWEAKRVDLEQREAACVHIEEELEERERDLAVRESRIADREQTDAATNERIAQFKSALREATEVFAAAAQGEETPPPPDDPDETPEESTRSAGGGSANGATSRQAAPGGGRDGAGNTGAKSQTNGNGNGNGNGKSSLQGNGKGSSRGANGAAAGAAGLPAPMVDQPYFDTGSGGPPSDWPDQLRERYRVLRRVSTKSDEDLVAQVQAEAVSPTTAPDPAADEKRKRRWWA